MVCPALPTAAASGLFQVLLPAQRSVKKQAKEQKAMLAALKKGDDVVTSGGLLGKVFAVSEKTLMLEVANGVKVRVLKASIQTKATVSDDPTKAEDPVKKEEK